MTGRRDGLFYEPAARQVEHLAYALFPFKQAEGREGTHVRFVRGSPVVDFSKFKATPRSEMRDHLYRCDRCGETCWYSLKLPLHLRSGHLTGGVGRRCGGILVWQDERPTYPDAIEKEGGRDSEDR